MLFNSIEFIIFFVFIVFLYFTLPHKYRWFLLLTGSCYFYMAFIPVYILILVFTVMVDYWAGIFIEKTEGKNKKLFLIASLIANIGVLAVFKYYNFLNDNLTAFLKTINLANHIPSLSIILPIGLSFHTFQAMSYTIEVYRGNQKAEKNFGIYALYVMFFPQLVAGPIARPQNLLHQFYERHSFDYYGVTEGLKLMLWGFFKKLVIADRLAIYVNATYDNPQYHNGTTLLVATVFFAFQIYCDFSGYSDIAIGAAKIMGFKLTLNFNRPYLSTNISEFWRRWHMSLTSWFRDYVFLPLSSVISWRISKDKVFYIKTDLFIYIVASIIIWFLTGFWHGANYTFIIWGMIHGFFLIMYQWQKQPRKKLFKKIGIKNNNPFVIILETITTWFIVLFAWIFFRANSLDDASHIIKLIFTNKGPVYSENPSMLIYSVFGILFLLLVESKQEYYHGDFSFMYNKSWIVRNLSYTLLIIIILLIGVFDGGQFIYFQF